jgi:multidrug efflux pump subunit AcrB
VGRREFNVQTTGDYESPGELRRTVVGQSGSKLVRLGDVATVEQTTEETTHRARFNGTRAVFVTATQREGANIFTVTEGIKQALDGAESE